MDSFLTDLYSFKICLSREDWRTWTISRALGFKVNTYYKDLRKGGDQHFPWQTMWRVESPPHVRFFMWLTMKSKFLTMVNLQKRALLCQIGVACASLMRKPLTIHPYIVALLESLEFPIVSYRCELDDA